MALRRLEFFVTRCLQDRPATLQDAAYLAAGQQSHIAGQQSLISLADAIDFYIFLQTSANNRPHGCVHTGRIATACHHGDTFHSLRLRFI